MYEKRVIDPNLIVDANSFCPPFVMVNAFNEESVKKFINDCQRLIAKDFEFITILIDSYGGHVYSLLSMIDYLNNCDRQIITVCSGKAMSCGSVLFSCGDLRFVSPNATLMVHSVCSGVFGKESEVKTSAQEVTRLNNSIFKILDQNTGQKTGFWREKIKDIENGELYLTPNQSIKYGLATKVGMPSIKTEVKIERSLEY